MKNPPVKKTVPEGTWLGARGANVDKVYIVKSGTIEIARGETSIIMDAPMVIGTSILYESGKVYEGDSVVIDGPADVIQIDPHELERDFANTPASIRLILRGLIDATISVAELHNEKIRYPNKD